MSGSASTTRRPSKPRARAISSSRCARDLVQRVVDAHHHVRRGGELAEAFGGERRDLGERLARDQLGRELAARPRPRPRPPRFRAGASTVGEAAASGVERVADLLERRRDAARRPRRVPAVSAAAKPSREALALGLGELGGMLGRPRSPARPVWRRGEVVVEQEFRLCDRVTFSRPALRRRGSWRS